jgi:hypothetical protein
MGTASYCSVFSMKWKEIGSWVSSLIVIVKILCNVGVLSVVIKESRTIKL